MLSLVARALPLAAASRRARSFTAAARCCALASAFDSLTQPKGMAAPTTLKLTYFPIKARAEPTRLALHIGGVPFEDVRIPMDQWPAMKAHTPFQHRLPVLEVDGEQLGQSYAILMFAGRLTGLLPQDAMQAAKARELACCCRASVVVLHASQQMLTRTPGTRAGGGDSVPPDRAGHAAGAVQRGEGRRQEGSDARVARQGAAAHLVRRAGGATERVRMRFGMQRSDAGQRCCAAHPGARGRRLAGRRLAYCG
jgi:glutathione S-transferase